MSAERVARIEEKALSPARLRLPTSAWDCTARDILSSNSRAGKELLSERSDYKVWKDSWVEATLTALSTVNQYACLAVKVGRVSGGAGLSYDYCTEDQ